MRSDMTQNKQVNRYKACELIYSSCAFVSFPLQQLTLYKCLFIHLFPQSLPLWQLYPQRLVILFPLPWPLHPLWPPLCTFSFPAFPLENQTFHSLSMVLTDLALATQFTPFRGTENNVWTPSGYSVQTQNAPKDEFLYISFQGDHIQYL